MQKRNIPLSQIRRCHAKFARCEIPTRPFPRHRARRPKAQTVYMPGASMRDLRHRNRRPISSPAGPRMCCFQEAHQILASRLFQNSAGNRVVGVAVLPARARIKIQRLLGPTVHNRFGRRRLRPLLQSCNLAAHNPGSRTCAKEARRMLTSLARVRSGRYCPTLSSSESLPCSCAKRMRRHRELFADRAHGVTRSSCGSDVLRQIRIAESFGISSARRLARSPRRHWVLHRPREWPIFSDRLRLICSNAEQWIVPTGGIA